MYMPLGYLDLSFCLSIPFPFSPLLSLLPSHFGGKKADSLPPSRGESSFSSFIDAIWTEELTVAGLS